MPRPAPRPSRPLTGIASLPRIKFTQQEVNAVVAEATKSVAEKMSVPVDQLSADMKAAIKTATNSALDLRAKAIIQRDVDAAVKDKVLAGVTPIDLLDTRMKAAKEGLAHIAADAQVEAVLDDTAKLLWKKYSALTEKGFSETQAFNLLLAEVQGRASRGR